MILAQIPSWTSQLKTVIAGDIGRIAWNTCLAIIPLALSFFLFNRPRSPWLRWGTYALLLGSFAIGIKKYNNGDILQAAISLGKSLWGVRAIFLAIVVGAIILLMVLDARSKSGRSDSRPIVWWIGLAIFILFLPNAPYILTDIIHFYNAVREISSAWVNTLVILPIYIIFIGTGWLAYLFSLINLSRYLENQYLHRYINSAELSLHFLSAIGIYIGRFIRFNSWSLITQPKQFLTVLPGELIGKFPLVVILLTFLIITALYSVCKYIIPRQPSSGY
jgi:uncharacterized membrane protein